MGAVDGAIIGVLIAGIGWIIGKYLNKQKQQGKPINETVTKIKKGYQKGMDIIGWTVLIGGGLLIVFMLLIWLLSSLSNG